MSSNKEVLLQNIRTLLMAEEKVTQCLEHVFSASRELITNLEREIDQECRESDSLVVRKQRMHRMISKRPPTPVARPLNLSTSSSKSIDDWMKTPPQAKISKDANEGTVSKSYEKEKKEKESTFPSLELKGKSNSKLHETKENVENRSIKVVPSCITAFYDESVYLDGYDEPQNLSSIANNWMCRYVQREYDLMQSVPQTLANIEDSFISSSAANFTNEPGLVIDDENHWIHRYKMDSNKSTLKNVSCNMASSVSNRRTSSTSDGKKLSSSCSSSEFVLSLPSVEEQPINFMGKQTAETRESSWCTVSDDNNLNEAKHVSQLKFDKRDCTKQTTKGKQSKQLNHQQFRGRLAILGPSHGFRKLSSCCSHTLYCCCNLCDCQFKHVVISKETRKIVLSGLVSRLVDKWENLSNEGRK